MRHMLRKRLRLSLLMNAFCCIAALSQALKVGAPAPAITAKPIGAAPQFKGWETYRGKYVVIDFWATWCGPCVVALPKVAALEQEFKGQPVKFLTVAMDEAPRVEDFLSRKHIELPTYVDGIDSPTSKAFGVYEIPVSAVVDPQGRIVALTSGDNITPKYLRGLLKGSSATLPALGKPMDLDWDKTQISWQDGVQPTFEAIIKPIQVSGGGIIHEPGSNRISGDGLSLNPMIQYAWQTDSFHVDMRVKEPSLFYRAVIIVPKGRENALFPTFQSTLQSTFGFRTTWEDQDRDVLVLKNDHSQLLSPSASPEVFEFRRGHITFHKQTTAKLAQALPNWTRMPVVDETSLPGKYDFELEYRDDRPDVLISELKSKYGLVLEPGKRKVRILVVEPD